MKMHYYKNLNNSDINFSVPQESMLFDAIPAESLLTEDIIYTLYDLKRSQKPKDYPFMSRTTLTQYLRLLGDKKFLKMYSPHELRNNLKLGR